MIRTTISLIIILGWWQGTAGKNGVEQNPTVIYKPKGSSVQINCTQNKGSTYRLMYWYRQRHGETMMLVAFTTTYSKPEYENSKKDKLQASKSEPESGSLTVKDLEPDDDAIYFCSVSEPGGANYQAYFGGGTKLTVLEPGKNITKPEVKIIEPSKKELCKKAVTLVCVAEKFYPDHVTIKWKIGNEDFTKGVATDPYARKNKETGMFEMSSRFKIKSNVYHNEAKRFQCIVSFYDGEGYINKTATVKGIAGKGFNKEKHMTEAATVKLAYGVFIAKSGLYGIFIFFFVRRQVSAGK